MYAEVFANVVNNAGPPEAKKSNFSNRKSGGSDFQEMMQKVKTSRNDKKIQREEKNKAANSNSFQEKESQNKIGDNNDERLSRKKDNRDPAETASELASMLEENDISALENSSLSKLDSEKLLELLADTSKANNLESILSASDSDSSNMLAELKSELESLISLLRENSSEFSESQRKDSISTGMNLDSLNTSGNNSEQKEVNIHAKTLELLEQISERSAVDQETAPEMKSEDSILKAILNQKITKKAVSKESSLNQNSQSLAAAENSYTAGDLKKKNIFKSINLANQLESEDAKSADQPKILNSILAGGDKNLNNNSDNAEQIFSTVNLKEELDLNSEAFKFAGNTKNENSNLNAGGEINLFDLKFSEQNNFISNSNSAAELNTEFNIDDQILDTFKAEYSSDKKQLSVQLEPESLGKIDINLSYEDDKLIGKMMVESELVRSNLEKSLSGLKNELVKEGINIEQFKIETAKNNPQQVEEDRFFFDQNMGNSPDGENRHNQQFERDNVFGSSYYSSNDQADGAYIEDKIAAGAVNAYQTSSGLNLLV